MFNPTRDQTRDFFFDAWRKFRANEALSAMETMTVDVIDQRKYTYNIKVTGTSGSLSRSTDVQLQVK